MWRCKLYFVLDNGTRLEGDEEIQKHLELFPKGILEKVRPIYVNAINNTTGWNHSIIEVYQDGNVKTVSNIPPEKPFNLDVV